MGFRPTSTPTHLGSEVAEYREYFTALVERQLCGDCRNAVLRPFHHEQARAHAADEVITYGKILRKCGGAHGELGNDQPFGSQLRGECAVVRGIDDIDAAAENSDGFPLRSESRLVCRGVDPPPFHSQW